MDSQQPDHSKCYWIGTYRGINRVGLLLTTGVLLVKALDNHRLLYHNNGFCDTNITPVVQQIFVILLVCLQVCLQVHRI